jgi:hypothetical protein
VGILGRLGCVSRELLADDTQLGQLAGYVIG